MTPHLCATCCYYRPIDGELAGVCHYEAPVAALVVDDDDDDEAATVAWGVWPLVEATDFCSHWKTPRLPLATRLRVVAADRTSRRRLRVNA